MALIASEQRHRLKSLSLIPGVCRCAMCGGELYEGNFCYRLDGVRICRACFPDWALERYATALELVE